LKEIKVNISLKDLNIIIDTMLGSTKIEDRLQAFKFSPNERKDVAAKLLNEMAGVDIEMSPNEP
jgi:hypothetical protein